ncbi:MAG: M15 family metallopeptidase [Flavobacteriales bacterium]|nr:M15 family metallopeptidase [Flavobacteriales bacterium]
MEIKRQHLYFGIGITAGVLVLAIAGRWAYKKFDIGTKLKLQTLHPSVRKKAEKFLAKARKQGINLIITSAYRDCKEQDNLYAQGRTKPGKVVTNARCGQSVHNYRMAFDVAPVIDGKVNYNKADWEAIGQIGESVGLQWGGRWSSFKDKPHFYDTGGKTVAQLMQESRLAA